jgi:small subunit ribosomal protein S6
MKSYELVAIFTSDENQCREGREFVRKELETAGITIAKEEEMGEKLLAYPIRRNDRGRYVLYVFESSAEPLKAIGRAMKLRPEILTHLICRQEA